MKVIIESVKIHFNFPYISVLFNNFYNNVKWVVKFITQSLEFSLVNEIKSNAADS